MTLDVWLVVMPGGDRPYCHAAPPAKYLVDKWKSEGGRVFRLSAIVTDHAPGHKVHIATTLGEEL